MPLCGGRFTFTFSCIMQAAVLMAALALLILAFVRSIGALSPSESAYVGCRALNSCCGAAEYNICPSGTGGCKCYRGCELGGPGLCCSDYLALCNAVPASYVGDCIAGSWSSWSGCHSACVIPNTRTRAIVSHGLNEYGCDFTALTDYESCPDCDDRLVPIFTDIGRYQMNNYGMYVSFSMVYQPTAHPEQAWHSGCAMCNPHQVTTCSELAWSENKRAVQLLLDGEMYTVKPDGPIRPNSPCDIHTNDRVFALFLAPRHSTVRRRRRAVGNELVDMEDHEADVTLHTEHPDYDGSEPMEHNPPAHTGPASDTSHHQYLMRHRRALRYDVHHPVQDLTNHEQGEMEWK